MIDLRKHFVDNIANYEYYSYKFGDYLIDYEMDEYKLYDDSDVIKEFKNLLYPYNKSYPVEEEMFIYLCFYLYSSGYLIENFPNFLDRPTDRWNLSYDKIRNSITSRDGYNGAVAWADRRIFIDNMKIEKTRSANISYDLDNMIKNISTRNASFQEMTLDERLKEICNCIEYILKQNGNFKVIDYSNSCEYLTDDIVKKYRNKLECFRHATADSLHERASYSDFQKEFLINYGILILNYIKDNS